MMAEQLEKPASSNSDEEAGLGKEKVGIECAICLQTCVYPVQLPCRHIFCFLCVKGVSLQSKRCAMCRRDIPPDFLWHPELLAKPEIESRDVGFEDGSQWFYEGRGGWWLYDARTSQEIETMWSRGEKQAELLIAGLLYIVDLEHMLQYRRNDPSRRRRIKRDAASGPKKGVAGIRIEGEQDEQAATQQDPTTDADQSDQDLQDNDPASDNADDDDVDDLESALENLTVNEAVVAVDEDRDTDSDDADGGG